VLEIAPGCLAFDEDLSAWIDAELAAPRRAAVEAHLASCSACTARVEQLRAVDRVLRALPAPAVAADLRERLDERLSGARAPAAPATHSAAARARRRFAPALALPLAAAAALALYLALPATHPEEAAEVEDAAEVEGAARSVPVARAPELPGPPVPAEGELEALDPEALAVVIELDTIEDLPVIANLELLERLVAAEAG
jgi:anti-sigma factor RsiW